MLRFFLFSVFFLFLLSCREAKETPAVQAPSTDSIISSDLMQQFGDFNLSSFRLDSLNIDRQIDYVDSIWSRQPYLAKAILIHAYQQSERTGYETGKVRAIGNLGKAYFHMGNTDTALLYLKQALAFAHKTDPDSALLSTSYSAIGVVYYQLSQFDTAAVYLYKSLLELPHDKRKAPKRVAAVYHNVGGFWLEKGYNERALQYFDKAEAFAVMAKDTVRLMDIAVGKAGTFFNKHQYDSALSRLQHILQQPSTRKITQIYINRNIGDILCRQQQPQQSLPYYQKAYDLSQETKDQTEIAKSYYGLGRAYFWNGNYAKAEYILEKVLGMDAQLFKANEIEYVHFYLSAVSDATRKYKKANWHLLQVMGVRDSLYKKETLEMVNKLDVQYRVAQKDKLLARHQLMIARKDSKLREQELWIGGIAVSSLFLLALLGSVYRSSKRKRRLHEKQLQVLQQEHHIDQLRAIMQGEEQERTRLARELHDGIGGMLAFICMDLSLTKTAYQGRVDTGRLDKLVHMVHDTSNEVRRTAHNLMPDTLTKHSLVDALVIYCNNISKEKGPKIEVQIRGNLTLLDKSTELLLYRMVQELIQNVVKHANASQIVLQLIEENRMIKLFVEDDGKGFDVTRAAGGYGLQNLRYRVRALHGDIAIMSNPGDGTTVFVEFNLDNLGRES